jgi:hypothetical protein
VSWEHDFIGKQDVLGDYCAADFINIHSSIKQNPTYKKNIRSMTATPAMKYSRWMVGDRMNHAYPDVEHEIHLGRKTGAKCVAEQKYAA